MLHYLEDWRKDDIYYSLERSVTILNYDDAENKLNEIISNKEGSPILSNVMDFLYENFDKYIWIGINIVRGDTLVLGPWKGQQTTEHIQIPIDSVVCGSAAKSGKTELVPDVNNDVRYLVCFVSTRFEIVVPIKKKGEIIGEIRGGFGVKTTIDAGDSPVSWLIEINGRIFLGGQGKWYNSSP
ncbi:MAG: hypothetical protein KAR64_02885 [Thermoplasmatales archaeon]|nr:hypothetical protein [Thermoplasmatales archaeon]